MEPLPPAEVEAADMLSSLPAHQLDEILTRLDLRDAVRTSALSCAWRRHWESLPGLALCFPRATRPSVIARVLLRYTRPSISRFAAYVVDDWLSALSRRSVESISIFTDHRRHLTLHSSIFSCDRLVSFNLENCSIPPRPRSRFAGFPVLQELHLRRVVFTDNGERELQTIIQGSPLLRELVLLEVFTPVDCMIEAPNLQTLVIGLQVDNGWRFGKLPHLQYANIDVLVYLPHGHGGHRLLEFFAGVSQVQELIFYSPIQDWEPECVTNSDIISEEWTDAQWTDGMCGNLQVVQINSYIRWLPLSFMKLILSKASLLRTLSVDVCPVSQDDPLK